MHDSLSKIILAIFKLYCSHCHKKWKEDSLEISLVRVLFAAELEFPKILALSLPQNTSNVNIENTGKSKQLYYLWDQLLGALIYLHFIVDINLVLIDYAWCKLCSKWLPIFQEQHQELKTRGERLLQLLLKIGW